MRDDHRNAGRDATVAWNLIDLKIKNETPTPVFIRVSASGGSLRVTVFGVPSPLGLGLYQQENPNIAYTGAGWKLTTTTLASGGSNRYSYTVGDSYQFKITNAGRFTL